MFVKIFLLIPLLGLVKSNHYQEEDVMESLSSLLYDFDVEDREALGEVRRIFDENGVDSEKLLADGILTGLLGLLGNSNAQKWAAVNFASQISCYQGRSTSLFSSLLYASSKYYGYGCYCGSGSHGVSPLDATDRCCQIHDKCYSRTAAKYKLQKGCHTYSTAYSVTCCKDLKITKCTNTGPSAGRGLCECDQEMARCLAQKSAVGSYNEKYKSDRSSYCKRGSKSSKPRSIFDILATCKHIFEPRKTFTQTVKSQGKCPPKKTGWFWVK